MAHPLDDRVGKRGHERLREPKGAPEAHRTAQHHPQHIATPIVSGHHTVADEEGDRPDVVSDDTVGDEVGLAFSIGVPGEACVF